MKILILGHGQHGKGTLARILAVKYGLSCISSSMAAAAAIRPLLSKKYDTLSGCHGDRGSHRLEWKRLITEYNTPDKTRLCREILENHDVYDGMRCDLEYQASKHLFGLVVWVEAGDRVAFDPSMGIAFNMHEMVAINNNGSPSQFEFLATQHLAFLKDLKLERSNSAAYF